MVTVAVHDAGCHLGARAELFSSAEGRARAGKAQRAQSLSMPRPDLTEERVVRDRAQPVERMADGDR